MHQLSDPRGGGVMNAETPIMQAIRLAIGGRRDARIFRNNVGMAFLADGTTRRYGLCKGSSDLIGWRTVTITPAMVGRRLAVFTAIEVKAPGGRASVEQVAFINAVNAAGGLAGLADSIPKALAIVERLR